MLCNVALQQIDTPSDVTQVAVLQVKLEATKQMLEDAKKDRDNWKEQAQTAFFLLTNNSEKLDTTKDTKEIKSVVEEKTLQPKEKKSLIRRLISTIME